MKTEAKQSVVKEWVSELPFTQQALLMLGLRGPDGIPKLSAAKQIVHYLRGEVLNAAYDDYNPDSEEYMFGFMRGDYRNFEAYVNDFLSDIDAYPLHFYLHLTHSAEVIAFGHPDIDICEYWCLLYFRCCKALHMNPETKEQFYQRLNK
jgi:hypothetical protein